MNVSEIKKVLEERGIAPLKRFGQHFLIDANVAGKIVNSMELTAADKVLEIGGGLGALTSVILNKGCSLEVCEIDRKISDILEARFSSDKNFSLIRGNFLDYKFRIRGKKKYKIISNLPYYLTSSIIFTLIEARGCISEAVLVMQKEMAERITAKPATPEYGAITVKVNLFCSVRKLFDISRNVFYPRPEVESAAVKFVFPEKPNYYVEDMALFDLMLKKGFSQRRKQFRKILADVGRETDPVGILSGIGLDRTARIEELETGDIVKIANCLKGK
ncbi:16S rRNA (adenine(1518)-N(6)/adenine(1519)-N(6))-dimethyltransferase RsmA [bacterium]|jgi:16S rRNA (adenine1518-N6/adenine1519-N6)-dimethyltransferase|nr:16S rRNA (adenine(1518)-N(6)/adenine(1519)-N(6))-dimethyltransferase RsmA [bacterium]